MKIAPLKAVDYLVVHRLGPAWDAAGLDAAHRRQGYRRIGYHYVVRPDGEVEAGRPEHEPGVHAEGYDRRSLGICLTGAQEDLAPEQAAALDRLINGLVQRYPTAQVLHWETR